MDSSPKLSFAKGTKLEKARQGVEGMAVAEVLPIVSNVTIAPSDGVEWLADSGTSRHVCTNLGLMWDVRSLKEPIHLTQLSGKLVVYLKGTIKLECMDKNGRLVPVELYDTLYVPEATLNLFSLQKLRKAKYRVVQPKEIGTQWIHNEVGKCIGSLNEDGEGRATVNCRTLPPPRREVYKTESGTMKGMETMPKDGYDSGGEVGYPPPEGGPDPESETNPMEVADQNCCMWMWAMKKFGRR